MVRAKVLSDLKHLFESKDRIINLHEYTDELFDVVFDIISADTSVAGIASKLIDRQALLPEQRVFINQSLFDKDGNWRLPNGTSFDIRPYHKVHSVALALEKLRAKCCQVLE